MLTFSHVAAVNGIIFLLLCALCAAKINEDDDAWGLSFKISFTKLQQCVQDILMKWAGAIIISSFINLYEKKVPYIALRDNEWKKNSGVLTLIMSNSRE